MEKKEIEEILDKYPLGELEEYRPITEAFQSMNYEIKTKKGRFAFRVIYHGEEETRHMMEIYDFLNGRGIKTPKPIRTRKGTYVLPHGDKSVVIQEFVEGKPIRSDRLLPFWGRELAKVQKTLCLLEGEKEDRDCIETVRGLFKKNTPWGNFVKEEYTSWEKEVHEIDLSKLSKGVIHGDCSPEDFFFKDGKFQAIMDFGAAHEDFILYDVATFLMYIRAFSEKEEERREKFIEAYANEFPEIMNDMPYLNTFLKTRFLFQIGQHRRRYEEGICTGVEKPGDNLKGVKDGIMMLKALRYGK